MHAMTGEMCVSVTQGKEEENFNSTPSGEKKKELRKENVQLSWFESSDMG